MSLFDDPRLIPLHREDRHFIGGSLAVLATTLIAIIVWAGWRGRPFTTFTSTVTASPQLQIDVNVADWPELALLPGVGEVLARRIVLYRESTGPFDTLGELDEVKGIGPKVLGNIEPYILPPLVQATVGR